MMRQLRVKVVEIASLDGSRKRKCSADPETPRAANYVKLGL
jgi:hypothetical protein